MFNDILEREQGASTKVPGDRHKRGEMQEIGKRLLGREGVYWRFYARESVEGLVEGAGP